MVLLEISFLEYFGSGALEFGAVLMPPFERGVY